MSTKPGTVVHTIVGDCGVEQSRIYCLINNLSKADMSTVLQYVGLAVLGWLVVLFLVAVFVRLTSTKQKKKKRPEHED